MKLLLVLLLVFSFSLARAQKFKAGLSFGNTATQVTGDNNVGYKKFGLFGGAFLYLPLQNQNKVQMEFDFIQKGSRRNSRPSDGSYDFYLIRLNYVEVPLFYEYNYRDLIGFQGGLALAFLVSAKEKDSYGTITPDPTEPYFKKTDLSYLLGFRVKIKNDWDFMFRFSYSLIPMRSGPLLQSIYYQKGMYNNVLTTSLQYNF